MEVDMRRDEPGELRGAGGRPGQARSLPMSEEAVYLAPERIRLARIRSGGMDGRPMGTRQPVTFDPSLEESEARAVEKPRLVEALDDLRDVFGPRRLPAPPARED